MTAGRADFAMLQNFNERAARQSRSRFKAIRLKFSTDPKKSRMRSDD